ncbi:hypothetical protein Q4E93_20495 [Flavitalea sp. BT771]|uniref:hypothetical protein n=1 Tax=Flavitalea sp. BT771 TaxID=3063329 RepID=UPI0026E492FD|nr:hypothetical protein [Flavitalea sp. BT771]MDO6432999.1 hypothetical protein [Flavitalea sp. BT771]MDV6221725.1 hypothetical protein [Flavitalea sp. BT771]
MKKSHFSGLIMLLLAGSQVSAQQKFTYDLTNLPPEKTESVKFNKPFQIIVNHVNKKVWKVDDAKTDANLNTTVPDALTGIKAPSFLFLHGLPAAPALAQTPAKDKATHGKETHPKESIEIAFEEIQHCADKLNGAILFYNKLSDLAEVCDPGVDVPGMAKTLARNYLSAADAGQTRSQLYKQMKDTLFGLRPRAEELVAWLKKAIPEYIETVNHQVDLAITEDEKGIAELKKELSNPRLSRDDRKSFEEKLKGFEDDRLKQVQGKEGFKKAVSELTDNLGEAEKTVADMFDFDKDNKLFTIVKQFSVTANPANYIYTSDVYIPKKDQTTVTLTFTPQDLTDCDIPDKKSTTLTFNATGGLKIDFSTGLFVNGGSEDFLGRTYYYQNLTDTTRQIISAQRGKRLMLSIGGLVHFYKRSPSVVKLGGSIGASTTADFDDLNFHIGPSLILGNKNRVILTAGMTLKSSKVLDQQLQMNTSYAVKASPDDIPTVSVFPKVGWFVGVSYNLNLDL